MSGPGAGGRGGGPAAEDWDRPSLGEAAAATPMGGAGGAGRATGEGGVGASDEAPRRGRGRKGPPDRPEAIGRELRVAGAGMVVAVLVGAAMAGAVTLAGAVVAQGSVVPDGATKRIQNPAGGVVATIPVHDGDRVARGDVVMTFDDTVAKANLASLTKQLDELAMRHARLDAELAGAPGVTFPAELRGRVGDEAVALSMAAEANLFESRRRTAKGKRDQYAERVGELERQIDGMRAQAAAKEGEAALIDQEMTGVTALYRKNLVSLNRLTTLQRDGRRVEGERGQVAAQVAEAEGRIAETRLQSIQVEDDGRGEALRDLRDVQVREADLGEKAVAARDVVAHVVARAPVDGVVTDLTQHTVGGVVGAGEVLMAIVPGEDRLVVEARVAPNEIDSVRLGGAARVKLPGLNQRTTPDLEGEVSYVGADVSQEGPKGAQPGASYYRVRVTLPAGELAKLGGTRVLPGMPAEVFMATASRSVLAYLVRPLAEQLSHAMRER